MDQELPDRAADRDGEGGELLDTQRVSRHLQMLEPGLGHGDGLGDVVLALAGPATGATQAAGDLAADGGLVDHDVDQLIDTVKGGKPDLLLTTRKQRRKLKALLAASTHYVETGESSFGRQTLTYDGIPVLISDFLTDTEAADNGTGNTFSSMYALHLSAVDGLVGLTNGGVQVVDVGQLETKDAYRVRIRWYVGLALLRDSAAGRLDGLN